MLDDVKKTISLAKLAKHAEQIADDIERSGTVYRLTRRGHQPILLVPHDYARSVAATAAFKRRHPAWRAELEQDDRALRTGQTVTLEELTTELGIRTAADSHAEGQARAPRRRNVARRTRPRGTGRR
jgi:hypothetical protein